MDRAGLSMNRAIKRQIRNYFISLNDLYDNKEDILSLVGGRVRRPSSFLLQNPPRIGADDSARELSTPPSRKSGTALWQLSCITNFAGSVDNYLL